jgi:hypothetical protein
VIWSGIFSRPSSHCRSNIKAPNMYIIGQFEWDINGEKSVATYNEYVKKLNDPNYIEKITDAVCSWTD